MKNEKAITAALSSTARIFRVSKFEALRRRITSSIRGWSQPGVVFGVECAPLALGVRGEEGVWAGDAAVAVWRRGVRLRMGRESVDDVVRVRDCCELDCVSAVDDMIAEAAIPTASGLCCAVLWC